MNASWIGMIVVLAYCELLSIVDVQELLLAYPFFLCDKRCYGVSI